MRTPVLGEFPRAPSAKRSGGLALVRDFGLILFVYTIGAHIAREADAFLREQRAAQQEIRSFFEQMRCAVPVVS